MYTYKLQNAKSCREFTTCLCVILRYSVIQLLINRFISQKYHKRRMLLVLNISNYIIFNQKVTSLIDDGNVITEICK